MGQFVGCIKGIGEAVAALDMPIVSGNVSLYNETDGSGILPTPTIGAVGIMATLDEMIRIAPNDGDTLILIGETQGHLGQSALLAEVFDREDGDAPHVDLTAERKAGEAIRAAKAKGLITAAHDLSDGGLAIAAADMALAANLGVSINGEGAGWFFGEDQARYLVACEAGQADALLALLADLDVPAANIGSVGGDALKLGDTAIQLAEIREVFDAGLVNVAV